MKRALLCALLTLLMPWTATAQTGPGQLPPVDTAAPRTILVRSIMVEGNSRLSEEEVRALVAPYEGRDLTLADLKELAGQLTQLYEDRGYYLTRAIIPAQDFVDGRVRIAVLEGKINRVTIEGADRYDQAFIQDHFADTVSESGFNGPAFQRAMLLLNEYPNLKGQAYFKKGEKPGEVDITVKLEEDDPVHVGLDYNNFGNASVGEHRTGLTLDVGPLLGRGDQLLLRTAYGFPEGGTNFYQARWMVPVDSDGTRVGFEYASGAFSVGDLLTALDVRGRANTYSLQFSRALDRSFIFSSDLFGDVTYKDVQNTALGIPFNEDRYATLRLGYSADWRNVDGRSIMRASVTQGLGGIDPTDPLASRLGASGGFTKLNLDAVRIQTLQEGLYAVFRGNGQVSTEPLLIPEQFAIGGPDSVRGYPLAEVLGDNGYSVSAELRYSPLSDPQLFQITAFYDHGTATLKNPQFGEVPIRSLNGAGFGFRFGFNERTNARLDLGFPIDPARNSRGESPILYGQIETRF